MRLYRPKSDYIQYLFDRDKRIINSENTIGVPIRLNELIYFLPIDSPSVSDYEDGVLKKSSPTIMRMFDLKTKIYLGKCLFSNMFSVPYKELEVVDITDFDEEKFVLMEKKLEYIKRNHDRIMKSAKMLFKQKSRNYKQSYLKSTVDFTKIENASLEWEIQKYGKHYNRFPDQNFFLINPNIDGLSEYYLMNKEVKIAKIVFDNSLQKIDSILEIYNAEYAPLECFNKDKLDSERMTAWFKGRGIPSWRDGLDDFLENLGIENKDFLLNRAYGLSLSDQYWMNPVERLMDWKDINFFDHDFNSQDFIDASFEDKFVDNRAVDFYSPNNTSDGMLKKAWIVGEDNQRYLLKGSFKRKGLEPFNEVLSGMIAQAINLEYIPYTIEVMNKTLFLKCKCFIGKDTELISAYAILAKENIDMKENCVNVMNHYIRILKEKSVFAVEEKLAKMFILDYLMVNQDRHLGNFGIIRNVNSLKWEDIAPNFDSGQAMFSQKEVYEMNFVKAEGCFFNNKNLDFEEILKHAQTLFPSIQLNFESLESIPYKWKNELKKYQYVSLISDEKIDVLIEGLKLRIAKLKENLFNRL
ncbi:type III toxin-antitoxin system ToxN/AbiQ family toxin [Thomasclavelia cocleata]|uniref:type III toxin-antitoxin system ToxN/AbiQ family toxin n=1 Tax=Thomasclavelia cocleata TaxID=69824 RepID=UPI00242DB225|nr:type III toxin-antitoxin system ToxN/AbiQ family toxin [Thomasclavelia cocleata]